MLCPAGTPHAISAGVLVVELQEPADLSIMLEWSTFSLAEGEATLGLPLDEALACIDRRACPPERLKELHGRPLNSAASARCCPTRRTPSSSPSGSTPRCSRHLSQSYGVLVVTAGGGHLATEDGSSLLIGRGSTVVIPHSAGPAVLSGDLEGVRCLPAA